MQEMEVTEDSSQMLFLPRRIQTATYKLLIVYFTELFHKLKKATVSTVGVSMFTKNRTSSEHKGFINSLFKMLIFIRSLLCDIGDVIFAKKDGA